MRSDTTRNLAPQPADPSSRQHQLIMSPMNPPSTRIRKRRAPQRLLLDPNQSPSVSRRRSSRIESRRSSVSIPHILGSYYESQSPLKQLAKPYTVQPVGAISNTHVPTPEASTPVPSEAPFQESVCLPQTHNPQTRKRSPDEFFETDAEPPPTRPRLTLENLKAFEKMGRPRKDPKPKSLHSSRSEVASQPSATSEASTKTISTTDSRFAAQISRNGILEQPNSKRPANFDYRREWLNRARETESPTESEYQLAAYKIQTAENEQTMLVETSTLLKGYERGYRRVYNQPFNDFPKNVGFNNGLSPGQPDMLEGLDLTQFDLFPIREESLLKAAVPSSGPNAITLSHLAGEWKGPGKDMNLARHQAAYDGAAMVYARDEACSFLGSPDPPGHAYVQTFTTDGTTLNTFAHYSTKSEGGVKYHQYPTSSSFLIASYEDYKTSRRRLRNLQDAARETSQNLKDKLNNKWLANQHQPPASTSVPEETLDVGSHSRYGDEGDREASCQLFAEAEDFTTLVDQDGYNPPSPYTLQPPSANYDNAPTDTALGHYPIDGPQVLTSDYEYNSDMSHNNPPVTPPFSAGHVSLPLKSHEVVDNSTTRRHRRTRQSWGPTEDLEARKMRKRR